MYVSAIVQSLSCVQLCVTPWTVAHKAPLSMGFSRQEYWSVFPFPFPVSLWTVWHITCLGQEKESKKSSPEFQTPSMVYSELKSNPIAFLDGVWNPLQCQCVSGITVWTGNKGGMGKSITSGDPAVIQRRSRTASKSAQRRRGRRQSGRRKNSVLFPKNCTRH